MLSDANNVCNLNKIVAAEKKMGLGRYRDSNIAVTR